jgi:transcription antitermination protein NusB
MANRHLSRSIVLQSLYEWDFGRKSDTEAREIFKRNAEEFAPGMADVAFMEALLTGILAKRKELDNIIEKAAPDWPIDKISVIDRNILRLGLYELLFSDRKEVPAKVAINEAIELAKNFGGETSGRFVNGVLGAIYKEIGEPGKQEVSKKKHHKDVDEKNLPVQQLGGAVVYAREGSDVFLALVHDVFGHWTLTKGRIEEGVELEKGTLQGIQDELGLKNLKIKEKLAENEYIAFSPESGKKKKHVNYFLVETDFTDIKLEEKGGLDDAKWFKLKDILELNFYNDILPIVTKAINIILAQK